MTSLEFNNSQSGSASINTSAPSVRIPLQYPLTIDGMQFDSLTLRRPLVRDRLIAEKASGSEAEKEIRFVANLCDMAPQHIELLDLSDYTKIQECLSNFLS